MTSFVLPDLHRFVLDAIEILYGDAKDARELMASDLGVSSDTVRLWTRGRRSPSRSSVATIRDMLIEKMRRAEAFRHRLDHGLPSMACPLCASDLVVHHHRIGRTAQCTSNPDHVFEPEAGASTDINAPVRFVQVPGGSVSILERDFNADCSALVVGETLRFPGRIPPVARTFVLAVGDIKEQPPKKAWLLQRSDEHLAIQVEGTTWILAPTYPDQQRTWTIAARLRT